MTIDRRDVAGWMLRCRPDVWDVEAAAAASPAPLPFGLQRTYRSSLPEPGDPVLLWTGGRGRRRGVAATGAVVAPADVRAESRLWRDPARGDDPLPYLDVALHFLPVPVTPEELRDVEELQDLEILRVPRAPNPSMVTLRQLRALHRLIGAVAAADVVDAPTP